ncbi:S41 family peptidase [Lentzea jiangxiensis]|uniref:Peptidase family S41 n=1 Tax=Lentzea jiangxiensis TaxID=641025 RepID=A0A1H0T500_9PSEU|nr:S41 family peptidase [Lentzea jiangxiensis]SDP49014.1 Peptidase family S41 [Lentzea jiangxiensis]
MRPEARACVDRALDLLQRHSIDSKKADWPALRAQAHATDDPDEAIRGVIAALGNPHTHLVTAERASSPRRTGVPTGRLTGSTGWLVLPGTHARYGRGYVTAGLKALRELIAARPTGWVVDLRGNGGGAMHPMLAVVAPLLGDGELGRFVGPHGGTSWGIRRGHVRNGTKTAFRLRRVPAARSEPVAVLVDRRTASSGEAVLISFLGAPDVRTFGEPTAGYATANQTFPLPGGAQLAITTALMADRTGRTYGNNPITPHVVVEDALAAAIEWLSPKQR